jgi:hypothetical protein
MDAKKPSLGCFLAHSPGAGSVFLPRNASSPNPQGVSVRHVPIARQQHQRCIAICSSSSPVSGEARRQCGRHSLGITTHGSRSIGLSARAPNSRYRESSAPNAGWPVMDWHYRTRSPCPRSWSSRADHTARRDRGCRQHYGVFRRGELGRGDALAGL